jgi:hypothetical protein
MDNLNIDEVAQMLNIPPQLVIDNWNLISLAVDEAHRKKTDAERRKEKAKGGLVKPRRKHKKQRKAYPDEEYSSSEEGGSLVQPVNKKIDTNSWLGGSIDVYPVNYNHASIPFY